MEQIKENKMGVMPVNRLLITMALPIMISMLVQALYNIVDSIYVARVSDAALNAVSLAFPAQNLMIAIGTGTGVGINALLSRSLGEKNFKLANKIAENGVFLAFMSYVLFLIFGLTACEVYFKAQTTNAEVISGGTSYLFVCSVFSFGVFGQIVFERLVQATGKTIYSMLTQGFGAIINIILDPIFIFGFFGIPAMGVTGAAIATVAGQICAMILGILLNHFKNPEVKLNFKKFRPSLRIIKEIYAIGIPSIIMSAITSVMTFCLNKILYGFTELAVNVLGIYFKLQSFVFMPVFGLNNGLVPIVSYNYGAGKRKRLVKSVKLALVYAFSILFVGFLVFQFACEPLLRVLFDASDEVVKIGAPALRIISLSFLLAPFCIIIISTLQSLGKGFQAMVISMVRQLVFLIPVAFLMSLTGVLNAVWTAFPIAELASVICAVFMFVSVYKKVISKIPNNE